MIKKLEMLRAVGVLILTLLCSSIALGSAVAPGASMSRLA
jgi:hypothetical protein